MGKYDGDLALGSHGYGEDGVNVASAFDGLLIGEVLEVEDDDGKRLYLEVRLDASCGEIDLYPLSDVSGLHARAIARSQMHSMLADVTRVERYRTALVAALKECENEAVMDIGAGTGLLALMAARAGAKYVFAVEMYEPLAELAKRVTEENGLKEVVNVLPYASTKLEMTTRADLLVTEIFDSALLGEGCLGSIAHARRNLLVSGARVIPASACLYARVVSSSLCLHRMFDMSEYKLHRDVKAATCRGAMERGIPVHLDALQEDDFTYISDEFEVFRFDFNEDVPTPRTASFDVVRTNKGKAHAVVTWWTLDFLGDGSITYSTKPGTQSWQDHWLPVVYPLKEDEEESEVFCIYAAHDEMRTWFSRTSCEEPAPCTCGMHSLPGGPARISHLGNKERMAYVCSGVHSAVKDVPSEGAILDISDGSVCALMAAAELRRAGKTGVRIVSLESHSLSSRVYAQVARRFGLDIEFVSSLYEVTQNGVVFDAVLTEPWFHACNHRPLARLSMAMSRCAALCQQGSVAEKAQMTPRIAQIRVRGVRFHQRENPFVRAERVVGGIQHDELHKLSKIAAQDMDVVHLPLYMHRYDEGEECEVASFDFESGRSRQARNALLIGVPDGSGQAAIAVTVWYDAEPPGRFEHSMVLAAHRCAETDACIGVSVALRQEDCCWSVSLDETTIGA